MRTTLDLDPAVLAELRLRARQERKSMGQVASELITQGARQATTTAPGFAWQTAALGMPNIDLEDDDAVGRALEGR